MTWTFVAQLSVLMLVAALLVVMVGGSFKNPGGKA